MWAGGQAVSRHTDSQQQAVPATAPCPFMLRRCSSCSPAVDLSRQPAPHSSCHTQQPRPMQCRLLHTPAARQPTSQPV
ncbi:hypothetical protein BC831DRAFT_452752, partial [Entophlyctis helioformis]